MLDASDHMALNYFEFAFLYEKKIRFCHYVRNDVLYGHQNGHCN